MDCAGREGAGGGVAGVDCFKGEGKASVGGGGAAGELDPFPKAFLAACRATDWLILSLYEECELGGRGGVERAGGGRGVTAGGSCVAEGDVVVDEVRSVEEGGGGGAAGGDGGARGAETGGGGAAGGEDTVDSGGGGAVVDDFRDAFGDGEGFAPVGGGGGARGGSSE